MWAHLNLHVDRADADGGVLLAVADGLVVCLLPRRRPETINASAMPHGPVNERAD